MSWNSRESDQICETLGDLRLRVAEERDRAREAVFAMSELTLGDVGGELALVDGSSAATLTHGAFEQLCLRASAPQASRVPRDYLAGLPAALAAANLNHALAERKLESRLLLRKGLNGSSPVLRALTSPGYERVWHLEILDFIAPMVEAAGLVPLALYLGERDMHVYLVDRDLNVGFVAWNTETGHGTSARALMFLYDAVLNCCLLARDRKDALDVRTMMARSVGDVEGVSTEIARAKAISVPREAKALHDRLMPLRLPALTRKVCEAVLEGDFAALHERPETMSLYAVALRLAMLARDKVDGADRLELEVAARAVLTMKP
jgi:hypothetical protein